MSHQAEASRAEAEAARWFEALRRTSVTTQALRDFHVWKRDPENAAAFGRVETSWKAAGALGSNPEVQAAVDAVLARHPARRRTNWRFVAAPIAAAAVGLAVWAPAAVSPSYETGVGEERVVALTDGSRVRLNTDSAVRVRYWGGERRVVLRRGQAFFDVAHDASRPFCVEAGPAEVLALGTKFDVRRRDGAVAVTLVEGRVRVEGEDGGAATLAPNQQLTVTKAGVSAPRPLAAAEAAGWTTGRLTFRGEPLRDVVAEANRYSRRKIELAVPEALAGERVSGAFDAGDIDAVVAALTQYYGLQAETPSADVIRLTPRPPAGA